MPRTLLAAALGASLFVGASAVAPTPSAAAAPGGCLKYGVAGAIAGRAVGHTFKGALAGCAAGMVRRRAYKRQMRMQREAAPAGVPQNYGQQQRTLPPSQGRLPAPQGYPQGGAPRPL